MSSATRLYDRLGQIPQDPEDPESLEDLVVCAFGAFERYYVCWKNRGGEYKQDSYDLPPTLKEWLFPTDGTTRDFPSLQVVFGRGDEYFASDKNGKLENKEPEIKKMLPPAEGDELSEKPAMRRSRTMSFLRPRSDPIARLSSLSSEPVTMEESVSPNRRSQSVSSQQQPELWTPRVATLRPSSDPITSTNSTVASPIKTVDSPINLVVSPFKTVFNPVKRVVEPAHTVVENNTKEAQIASPIPKTTRPILRSRPRSMSFNPGSIPKIVEGKQLISESSSPSVDPAYCTCGCHISALPAPKRSTYTDSSMQTDPITPPLRTALRIDTATENDIFYSNTSSALELQTPFTEDLPAPNPVYMGRMMEYFSKPGYQLGDSLFSSYRYDQQPIYEEEYIDEEDWVAERGQMG